MPKHPGKVKAKKKRTVLTNRNQRRMLEEIGGPMETISEILKREKAAKKKKR